MSIVDSVEQSGNAALLFLRVRPNAIKPRNLLSVALGSNGLFVIPKSRLHSATSNLSAAKLALFVFAIGKCIGNRANGGDQP